MFLRNGVNYSQTLPNTLLINDGKGRYNAVMETEAKNTKKTTVYLPIELDKQIRERAKVTRRSYNSEIVWLLEQQVAKKDKEQCS